MRPTVEIQPHVPRRIDGAELATPFFWGVAAVVFILAVALRNGSERLGKRPKKSERRDEADRFVPRKRRQ